MFIVTHTHIIVVCTFIIVLHNNVHCIVKYTVYNESRVWNTIHKYILFRVYRYNPIHDPIKFKHYLNTNNLYSLQTNFFLNVNVCRNYTVRVCTSYTMYLYKIITTYCDSVASVPDDKCTKLKLKLVVTF